MKFDKKIVVVYNTSHYLKRGKRIMLKNNEIACRLEEINSIVSAYVYEKMNDEFKESMYSQRGSHAAFKTAAGLAVGFTSYREFIERHVCVGVNGRVNGKTLQINFDSSLIDYGMGTIYYGNYGIAFWNVGDDQVEPIIKPFIDIGGVRFFIFANKAIDVIAPLLEQISEDIKTISPDLDTKMHLRHQDDVSVSYADDVPEVSRTSKIRESLEDLREDILDIWGDPMISEEKPLDTCGTPYYEPEPEDPFEDPRNIHM